MQVSEDLHHEGKVNVRGVEGAFDYWGQGGWIQLAKLPGRPVVINAYYFTCLVMELLKFGRNRWPSGSCFHNI
jgi:hypothetical protein